MFHLGSHPADRRLLRSRLYLLGLLLAFIGPLLASAVLYYNPQLRTDPGGHSHGALILPPRPLDPALFRTAGQAPRWTLLYRAQADACGLHCEATLFMMRQAHASLGSKRHRAQLLIMLAHDGLRPSYAPALQRFAPERIRTQPPGFDPAPFADLPPDTLFLVDPLGNLLMHYDDRTTSRGLLKDLKRLLAASRIG